MTLVPYDHKNFIMAGKSLRDDLIKVYISNDPKKLATQKQKNEFESYINQCYKNFEKKLKNSPDRKTSMKLLRIFSNSIKKRLMDIGHTKASANLVVEWVRKAPYPRVEGVQTCSLPLLNNEGKCLTVSISLFEHTNTPIIHIWKTIQTARPNDYFLTYPDFFQNFLKGEKKPYNFLPCDLRSMPGLANCRWHDLKMEEKSISHRLASSHIYPLHIYDEAQADWVMLLNCAQIIQAAATLPQMSQMEKPISVPILFQTLLSPSNRTKLLSVLTHLKEIFYYSFKLFLYHGTFQKFPLLRGSLTIKDDNFRCNKKEEAIKLLKQALAYPEGLLVTPLLIFDQIKESTNLNDPIKNKDLLTALGLSETLTNIKPILISTNHAINYFFGAPTEIQGIYPELINLSQQFLQEAFPCSSLPDLSKEMNPLKRLHEIVACYDKIIKPPLKNTELDKKYLLYAALKSYLSTYQKEKFNRHICLFRASLEQIIVESLGGLAYGSCKSGKDRKGIEIIHTDAMLRYFLSYQKLPAYDDNETDRKKFVAFIADGFKKNYQQKFNATFKPGLEGILYPNIFLPRDAAEDLHPFISENSMNAALIQRSEKTSLAPNLISKFLDLYLPLEKKIHSLKKKYFFSKNINPILPLNSRISQNSFLTSGNFLKPLTTYMEAFVLR